MDKREPSYTIGANVNWCNLYVEQRGYSQSGFAQDTKAFQGGRKTGLQGACPLLGPCQPSLRWLCCCALKCGCSVLWGHMPLISSSQPTLPDLLVPLKLPPSYTGGDGKLLVSCGHTLTLGNRENHPGSPLPK